MSVTLTVNGLPFSYPSAGEAPGWGENATDWASAVTDTVNGLIGPGDILASLFSITNNQGPGEGGATPANVTGLLFNSTAILGAIVYYSVTRKTDTNEAVETGELRLVYKPNSATWIMAQSLVGNAGISFSVTSLGQIQYTTSNLSGSNYIGKMRFRAYSLAS